MNIKKLTHFDDNGDPSMVDINEKENTVRVAVAIGKITMSPETLKKISSVGEKEVAELAEKNTKLAIETLSQVSEQQPFEMTAWSMLNAVTYIIDHRLGSNQDSRLRQAWFGSNAKLKTRALELALAL